MALCLRKKYRPHSYNKTVVNGHYYDWPKHKHGLLDGSRKRKKVFLVLVLAVTFYQVVTFSFMERVWALTVQSQIKTKQKLTGVTLLNPM